MREPSAPRDPSAKPYRKCVRLRFEAKGGKLRLLAHERLNMICPPSVGEHPHAGHHGGYWMELRDKRERVLFHRPVDAPFGDVVEVHTPEGNIEQVTGPAQQNVFEVLLPDDAKGRDIALMGESQTEEDAAPGTTRVGAALRRPAGAQELARFGMPAKAGAARKTGARKPRRRKAGARKPTTKKPQVKKPRPKKTRARKLAARKKSAKPNRKSRKKGRRR